MADESSINVVALNDVIDLLGSMSSGKLTQLLSQSKVSLPGINLADCDTRCGCNSRDCACHGSVSRIEDIFDRVSFPELVELRERKLADLKAQLEKLESFKLR